MKPSLRRSASASASIDAICTCAVRRTGSGSASTALLPEATTTEDRPPPPEVPVMTKRSAEPGSTASFSRRKRIAALVSTTAAGALPGFAIAQQKTLRIGYITALSGPRAPFGVADQWHLAKMRELLQRKDGPAIRDTIIWFSLIIAAGVWGFYWWGSWWAATWAPPSVPSASTPTPAARAATAPPLEPPGVSAGSQGLRVTPVSGLAV